jgi:hypothetical protein
MSIAAYDQPPQTFSLVKRDIYTKKEKVVQTGLREPIASLKMNNNNKGQMLMAGKFTYFLRKEGK